MYTLFKYKPNGLIMFIMLLFAEISIVKAQYLNINSMVIPPYSPSLTDYTERPGKLNVFIQTSYLDFPEKPLKVYVTGRIMSMDEKIDISTRQGWKPNNGIISLAENSIYTLTTSDLAQIFDFQNLVCKGITREQLSRYGLPEGAYQFYFTVYRYSNNLQLSYETVSPVFTVTPIEPPILIKPYNEQVISSTGPQNILFNWSMPSVLNMDIRYTLKIVELDKPTRNPVEAMNSTGYPVFFETEVTNTVYLYTVANPPLTKGKQYAYRVTAHELSSLTHGATSYFRNDGKSEVYTFTYNNSLMNGEPADASPQLSVRVLTPSANNVDSSVWVSSDADLYLKWTLNRFSNSFNRPKKPFNIDSLIPASAKFRVDFYNAVKNQKQVVYDSIGKEIGQSSSANTRKPINTFYTSSKTQYLGLPVRKADQFLVENNAYQFKITLFDSITGKTIAESEKWAFRYKKDKSIKTRSCIVNGTLKYRFGNETDTYPILNECISLEDGYFVSTKDGKTVDVSSGALTNRSGSPMPLTKNDLINKSENKNSSVKFSKVAVTTFTTDANGHFSVVVKYPDNVTLGTIDSSYSCIIDGKKYSGVLSHSLRVVISSPYYYQPEQGISLVAGADTINAGNIITHVKSYTLKSFITKGYAASDKLSKQIEGQTVYLLRKSKVAGLPVNEGTAGMKTIEISGRKNIIIGEAVAVQDKDKFGHITASVTFSRLVASYVSGDEYYILVKGDDGDFAQRVAFNENGEFQSVSDSHSSDKGGSNSISTGKGKVDPRFTPDITINDKYDEITKVQLTKGVLGLSSDAGKVVSNIGVQNNVTTRSKHNGGQTAADMAYQSFPLSSHTVEQIDDKVEAQLSGTVLNNIFADYPIVNAAVNFSFNVETAYKIVTDEYPKSVIKGKLVYTWPKKPGFAKPLANMEITLIKCQVVDYNGQSKLLYNGSGNFYGNNSDLKTATPSVEVIKTTRTNADGTFNIEYNNVDFTVGETLNYDKGIEGKVCIGVKDLNHYNNDFEFYDLANLQPKTVYRIVVAHNAVYMSPDNDIVVKPLGTVDVGTLKSNILSFKHQEQLTGMFHAGYVRDANYNNSDGKQNADQLTELNYPIENLDVDVYLVHKNNPDDKIYPEGEGDERVTGTIDSLKDYHVISKTKTDKNGYFSFDNVIYHFPEGDENYNSSVYVVSPGNKQGESANFEPTFLPNEYVWTLTKIPDYLFNNDYNYLSTDVLKESVWVKAPVLKGRVVSNLNLQEGVKGAQCSFDVKWKNPYNQFDEIRKTLFTTTDDKGYFEISFDGNVFKDYTLDVWQSYYGILHISKEGFGHEENGQWKSELVQTFGNNTFLPGKQIFLDKLILSTSGQLQGNIICKSKSSGFVPSYVQFVEVNNGTYGKKGEMMRFDQKEYKVPALPGKHVLIVIPVDPAYFSDTIPVEVKSAGVTTKDVEVFERKHRINFYIKEWVKNGTSKTEKGVDGATVVLCDGQATTISSGSGKVEMNFFNVSVDNLTMKISGPKGSGFIPQYVTFHNNETENTQSLPTVYLERGIGLSGKVKLDGQPTGKARVYADVSNAPGNSYSIPGTYSTESKSVYEATVDNNGDFVFEALPPEVNNKSIQVYAVYKPETALASIKKDVSIYGNLSENIDLSASKKTVAGDSKYVSIPSQSSVELNLVSLDNRKIDNIWGFPVQITKAEVLPSNNIRISGILTLSNYSPGFDIINQENLKFQVNNVELQPVSRENGVILYNPVLSSIPITGIRSLKLKYFNTYNTEFLSNSNDAFVLTRKNNTSAGYISGLVHIVDNSFKYPSSYLEFKPDQFYFNKDQKLQVSLFTSDATGNGNVKTKFNLSTKTGSDMDFHFIGFPTTSNKQNSYIEGKDIVLDATLSANIKNYDPGTSESDNAIASPVTIHLPKLVLNDNRIDITRGTELIIITLNDRASVKTAIPWKLEVSGWRIDPSQGGLYSDNCMLRTGKLDIPVGMFNLRNDFAYLGKISPDKLMLGNYPVNLGPSKVIAGFNPCTGSDRKGHWEVMVYPQQMGTPVATIKNLSPNLTGELQLETISLLSNGEDIFTIGTGAAGMKLYNLTDFKPVYISTNSGGFGVTGIVDFKIPGITESLGATLNFSSGNTMKINPLSIPFTGKGNVMFKPDMTNDEKHQYWSNSTFTAYGTIEEPGKLDPVNVKLTYSNSSGPFSSTIVQSDQKEHLNQLIKIGKNTTYLSNIACSMHADTKEWDNFSFEGDMTGFNGLGSGDPNRLKFTVFGEIKATGQTLKAAGFEDKNFEGLELTYDRGRLLGTLNVSDFPMGSFFVSGSLNVLMDKQGWCFYACATAKGVPMPEPCTANVGVLVGNYGVIGSDIENTVLRYAIRKEMPKTFTTKGLKGYFVLAGRDLPISGLDIDVNVIVANAYVNVPVAGIDAYTYLNMANGLDFGMGIDGKLKVVFGLNAITCTHLEGGATACLSLESALESKRSSTPKFNLSGYAGISAYVKVKQEVFPACLETIFDQTIQKEAHFNFSLSPFKADFGLGNPNGTAPCN